MAIRNHYLTKDSAENDVIKVALKELVSQAARVVAKSSASGSSYQIDADVTKLVRINEVRQNFEDANQGW